MMCRLHIKRLVKELNARMRQLSKVPLSMKGEQAKKESKKRYILPLSGSPKAVNIRAPVLAKIHYQRFLQHNYLTVNVRCP